MGSESGAELRRYAARIQGLGAMAGTISLHPFQSHILFVLSAKFGVMPVAGNERKTGRGFVDVF
jgi:hypothetical protein